MIPINILHQFPIRYLKCPKCGYVSCRAGTLCPSEPCVFNEKTGLKATPSEVGTAGVLLNATLLAAFLPGVFALVRFGISLLMK